MENNYYTPSLKEFHIGFECEWQCKIRKEKWNKQICDVDLVNIAYSAFEHSDEEEPYEEQFRVKYLDKEDIESLGWKKEENCFVKDHCKLYLYGNTHIQIQSLGNLNFNGTIKNKSELIKLLKQLNITNE
jgi:hypothetical protein